MKSIPSTVRSAVRFLALPLLLASAPALRAQGDTPLIAQRLPYDVRPLGLRPVAFRYVRPWGDPAVPRIGLIAEEVAEVFPEAVLLDAEGRPQAIDYRVLTGAVIEEVETRTVRALEAAIGCLAGAF